MRRGNWAGHLLFIVLLSLGLCLVSGWVVPQQPWHVRLPLSFAASAWMLHWLDRDEVIRLGKRFISLEWDISDAPE